MTTRDCPSFKVFAPLSFFEKADAPEGARRRIAGLITTERRDREGEVILQRGLDFQEYLDAGWLNDNHSKESTGIVGYPESVKFVRKGDPLPDGNVAPADGHWSEGVLLEGDERADKIWQKGLALQKSGGKRKLGFSIEGVIQRRAGADNKIIAKAKVRNVAITHCPVNTDTYLNTLEKALRDEERSDDEESTDKALSVTGGAALPGSKPAGPVTGAGAGAILTPQSLEHDEPKLALTKSEAVEWVQQRYPNITKATAERVVQTSFSLRDRGLL